MRGQKYGIVDPVEEIRNGVYRLQGVVEKPGPEHAPSRLACVGSYVLTPDIFEEIQNVAPGKGGEYYLPDAVRALMKKRDVFACRVEGSISIPDQRLGGSRQTSRWHYADRI